MIDKSKIIAELKDCNIQAVFKKFGDKYCLCATGNLNGKPAKLEEVFEDGQRLKFNHPDFIKYKVKRAFEKT